MQQLQTLKSDSINFAALPKGASTNTKKKTCKKGTACGGSCISASKTCKTKQSSEVSTKTKQLKEKVRTGSNDSKRPKNSGIVTKKVEISTSYQATEPKRPTKKEAGQMTDEQRLALREKLKAYQPEGKLTNDEKEMVEVALSGRTQGIASRMANYEADFVNGLVEDDDREIDFYNGMKKYQNSAPKPNVPIYLGENDSIDFRVGSAFNKYGTYHKFSTKKAEAKGKVLVVVPSNKSGFKSMDDSNSIISDARYVVDSVKKQGERTVVILREEGKTEKPDANISRVNVTGSGLG